MTASVDFYQYVLLHWGGDIIITRELEVDRKPQYM